MGHEPATDDDLRVVDAPEHGRYELLRAAERVGHADYRLVGDELVVDHVETVRRHRGHGFAARLMAGLVDDAARRGLRITPICSYAVDYLRDHPPAADQL